MGMDQRDLTTIFKASFLGDLEHKTLPLNAHR